MKKILFITLIGLLMGCSDYQIINTTIFKGVVSDKVITEPATHYLGECVLYIQNSKQTKQVLIPYHSRNEYKIEDTAIMIIQQVKRK
jgi:hypothetical protein